MRVLDRVLIFPPKVKKSKKIQRHTDGSVCLEGTKRVPKNFKTCCEVFEAHTTNCYYDIRYEWDKHWGWNIVIPPSAAGGGIVISYCPHCGLKLKQGKRIKKFKI